MKRFTLLADFAILITTGGQAFACTAYGGCSASGESPVTARLQAQPVSAP